MVNFLFLAALAVAIALQFMKNLELDTLSALLLSLSGFAFLTSVYNIQFGYYSIFGDFVTLASTWIMALRNQFNTRGHFDHFDSN